MDATFEYITAQRLMLQGSESQETLNLPESNTPSLADDGVLAKHEVSQQSSLEDLSALYRETFESEEPANQYVLNCFITKFFHEKLGQSFLVLDDYKQAFTVLRREAVEEPEDMRSSVKNTRTAKYLYSPAAGQFALTSKGEKLLKGDK